MAGQRIWRDNAKWTIGVYAKLEARESAPMDLPLCRRGWLKTRPVRPVTLRDRRRDGRLAGNSFYGCNNRVARWDLSLKEVTLGIPVGPGATGEKPWAAAMASRATPMHGVGVADYGGQRRGSSAPRPNRTHRSSCASCGSAHECRQ